MTRGQTSKLIVIPRLVRGTQATVGPNPVAPFLTLRLGSLCIAKRIGLRLDWCRA
jgi:hypothetical protein